MGEVWGLSAAADPWRKQTGQLDCFFLRSAWLAPRSLQVRAQTRTHTHTHTHAHKHTHTHTQPHTHTHTHTHTHKPSTLPHFIHKISLRGRHCSNKEDQVQT